jgi:hypothetical protein
MVVGQVVDLLEWKVARECAMYYEELEQLSAEEGEPIFVLILDDEFDPAS